MLRLFLTAPPEVDRADAWVRYSRDGRPVARGRDVPGRWPADSSLEVVLAAQRVRLATLTLPPMPRNRVRQAVRYALEDQMATAAEECAVAVAQSGRDVVAAIASEALIRGIAAQGRPISRIIPESALAPIGDGWTWCRSAGDGGFIRRDDGSAFAVGAVDGELPSELRLALAQATRAGRAPAAVHVAMAADAAQLATWSQATGVPFVSATAWHWEASSSEAFAMAPDFLAGDVPAGTGPTQSSTVRSFRPALLVAGLALAIHAGGMLVQWGWLNLVDWRLSRAIVQQATASGFANITNAAAASSAIARRNAELRHRAGRPAPGDGLPLLARAAPSIATLPGGTLKSISYANQAWTLELAKLDADAVSRVTQALHRAGIDAVSAPAAGGTRMRLTLDITAH
jgi:type II secretory pathway component PulL